MNAHQSPEVLREKERSRIQAAADRLIAGKPLYSTGELTVVQLATEAGLKRWVLTHRHTDLMRSFQIAAKELDRDTPSVEPWRERVRLLEEKLSNARAENAQLTTLNEVYAQTIHDLGWILDSKDPSAPVPFKKNRI